MRELHRPSPAVSFVGRHNSGKTTLLEKVIAELVSRGLNIGTIKHHGHPDFDIDIPGKDSFRHRAAGSVDSVIVSSGKIARVTSLDHDLECSEIVKCMPDHDLIIVEGYRKSGLDVIELFRAASDRDVAAAREFCIDATIGGVAPQAVVTDMPDVSAVSAAHGIPSFGFEDIDAIATYLENVYARPKLTVVVQAGGESRRMGQSKALVGFLGEPMITRILHRIAPAADEIVVTTNEPDRLAFLHDIDFGRPLRLASDVYKERGALRGFCTAIAAARTPLVALVACDMVYASPSLIIAEAATLHAERKDAVVPVTRFGLEPFHAVYRKDACLDATRELVEHGSVRMVDVFDRLDARFYSREETRAAAPDGGCFINVNTPDELAHIESSILGDGDRG